MGLHIRASQPFDKGTPTVDAIFSDVALEVKKESGPAVANTRYVRLM